MSSKKSAPALNLQAFKQGPAAGLASVAEQVRAHQRPLGPAIGGTLPAVALPPTSMPASTAAFRRASCREPSRLSARPTRRTYFRFAAWAVRQPAPLALDAVTDLWTQGNAALAQEWLDDLFMALNTPDPDDDLAPCIAEKFDDVMHGIHRSAMEIDL